MERKMKKGPREKGSRCEEHEKELSFRSVPPAVERIFPNLPSSVSVGEYSVVFAGKAFGGYKVDILRTPGHEVASGVRVGKWIERKVKDPENDAIIMLKLSFVYPQSIRVTIFKDGKEQ